MYSVRLRRRPALAALAFCAALAPMLGSGLPAARAERRVLHFRLTRDGSLGAAKPRDALAATQTWCRVFSDEISARWKPTDCHVQMATDLDLLAEELAAGTADAAYVSALEYVRLKRRVDVRPLATLRNMSGGTDVRGAILVRKSLGAKSVADLRGKRFTFVGETSSESYLYPQWLLHQRGLPAMREFLNLRRVKTMRNAVYDVVLDQADAAAVSLHTWETIIEMRPPIARQVDVLCTSQPMPFGVLIAGPHVEDGLVDAALDYVRTSDASKDTRLSAALAALKVKGLVPADDSDFDFVRTMTDAVDRRMTRRMDPICGTRISEGSAAATVDDRGETVRFCSGSCADRYRSIRARTFGEHETKVVVALSPSQILGREPADAIAALGRHFELITCDMEVDVAFELVSSPSSLRARLRDGSIDVATVTGSEYVRLHQSIGVKPLVRHVGADERVHGVVVVLDSGSARSITDLRGAKVAVAHADSSDLAIYLRSLVRGLGIESASDFFDEIQNAKSEVNALTSVLVGSADVAVVSSQTLDVLKDLDPGRAKRLRQVKRSDVLSAGPLVHRPDLAAEVVEQMRTELARVHESPAGKAALELFGVRRLVPATDSDYDAVRAMLSTARE